MKDYLSIALVLPLLAICAACAEIPYAVDGEPEQPAAAKTPLPVPMPARKPAIVLLDAVQTGAPAVSSGRKPEDDANDDSPANGPTGDNPHSAAFLGEKPPAPLQPASADASAAQPEAETIRQ